MSVKPCQRRQVHAFLIGEADELGSNSQVAFRRHPGMSDLSWQLNRNDNALPFSRFRTSVEKFKSYSDRGDVNHSAVMPLSIWATSD